MRSISIQHIYHELRNYIEREDYKGWDPYDGLNSKFFQLLPLKKVKLFRLLWIQFFKNNPINLRNFFRILKEYNPKAIALFISGYVNLYKKEQKNEYLDKVKFLIDELMKLKSKAYKAYCWGYNFDWQSRAFFFPKYTPTVVVSSFIGNALLDAYEIFKDNKYIRISSSICDFILNDLNKSYDKEGNICFSYSPLDGTQVFNASLLGAQFLSRMYFYTKKKELINTAESAVKFVIKKQNPDGSWYYGTLPHHKWIDNFHTGYNLEAIGDFIKYSGKKKYEYSLKKGLYFYIKNFFEQYKIPKYYDNKLYPVDIHNIAQFIVTLSKLDKTKEYKYLLDYIIEYAIRNMWEKNNRYFYFQKRKYYTIKIPYIRWAQAWMFYSFSFLI